MTTPSRSRPGSWLVDRAGRSWSRAVVLAGVAILALVNLPAPTAAQRSIVIERLHSDIEVQPAGDLIVTETLRPRFTGEWNGVVRRLEVGHTTAAGERERLEIDFVSATDEQGRALRTEQNTIGSGTREFKMYVPDARDRTAEIVLRYRVRGAIRYFAGTGVDHRGREGAGDYDEIYWQVTGTDWEVPIEDASATVRMPAGGEPLQAAAYRGRASDTTQVDVTFPGEGVGLDPNTIAVPSSGRLNPGQGLTVAVSWPAGVVAMPAGAVRSRPVQFGPTGSVIASDGGRDMGSASFWALLPLLLPLIVFRFAYRAWDRRGRDPKERAITVRWEPPTDLGPAETGTLVDHSPGMHDIISTLVDLAVRGYVVIAEREKKGFLEFGKDFAFHLVRPRTEWDDLDRHEQMFLNGLFKGGTRSEVLANLAEEDSLVDGILETVAGEPASDSAPENAVESVFLSDLANKFYKEIPDIREALLEALVAKGHYLRRPDRVRTMWGAAAGGTFLLSFLAVPAFATETATGMVLGLSIMVAAGISGITLAVFAFVMPARTEKGARTREAALGFERFLERVESPRYRRMITSADQFEEFLPYAMAFRCADKWAEAFDDLLTEPPEWYHGRHSRFRATSFASDLGTLASTASSTLASSPSSSGSGGGGSVGGGSGGGGGGGF